MNPPEVARNYDQLADQWNSNAFPRDYGIKQHERAIAFLKEKRTALDIGCGSSGRIIDLMTSHGFEVEGLDLSQRMIELARQRHPNVTFHHSDICEWSFLRKYDLISAWDSIWHLPLANQEPVLRKILQGLTLGGVCIFTTGGLDAPSEKVDSAMGPQMYYSVLGIPTTLKLISDTGCVCRHLEYDQYPELHLCVIAQRVMITTHSSRSTGRDGKGY
jgi:SAM-dependent methyltransferase